MGVKTNINQFLSLFLAHTDTYIYTHNTANTHAHTPAHTHTDITDSHLKMLEGFIFYKSSINGKVNVALNKTKLLNCNTALSL